MNPEACAFYLEEMETRGMKMEELKHDPDSMKDFATEWLSRLCQQLLDMGAPGIHFYTLNPSPRCAFWTI